MSEERKIIIKNKKAYFDYEVIKTYEAGIKLQGSEVKAIRQNKININDSYVTFKNKEAFLTNVKISNIKSNTLFFTHEESRPRKILLHKREINYLFSKVKEERLTVVPLLFYFSNQLVKVEIGLCRGKKLFDKRETIKKREQERKLNDIRGKYAKK